MCCSDTPTKPCVAMMSCGRVRVCAYRSGIRNTRSNWLRDVDVSAAQEEGCFEEEAFESLGSAGGFVLESSGALGGGGFNDFGSSDVSAALDEGWFETLKKPNSLDSFDIRALGGGGSDGFKSLEVFVC